MIRCRPRDFISRAASKARGRANSSRVLFALSKAQAFVVPQGVRVRQDPWPSAVGDETFHSMFPGDAAGPGILFLMRSPA